MSPWIVGFTAFFGYPLVLSVFLSFTHYDLLSSPRWVGLANYKFLFEKDQQVWPAVKNTLWLMAIFVPLQVLFASFLTKWQAGHVKDQDLHAGIENVDKQIDNALEQAGSNVP